MLPLLWFFASSPPGMRTDSTRRTGHSRHVPQHQMRPATRRPALPPTSSRRQITHLQKQFQHRPSLVRQLSLPRRLHLKPPNRLPRRHQWQRHLGPRTIPPYLALQTYLQCCPAWAPPWLCWLHSQPVHHLSSSSRQRGLAFPRRRWLRIHHTTRPYPALRTYVRRCPALHPLTSSLRPLLLRPTPPTTYAARYALHWPPTFA